MVPDSSSLTVGALVHLVTVVMDLCLGREDHQKHTVCLSLALPLKSKAAST